MLEFNRSLVGCGVLALTLVAAPKAGAIAILDSEVYTGHTYYLLETATWADSEVAAIALGGHLVAINDALENEFVRSRFGVATGFFADRKDLWLGLTDAASEGVFVWTNGDPVTYTNWVLNEPNDCAPTPTGCLSEDYVHMPWWASGLGEWNDVPDFGPGGIYGVVEIEQAVPEPSSLLLLGLGLTIVVRARRRGRRSSRG